MAKYSLIFSLTTDYKMIDTLLLYNVVQKIIPKKEKYADTNNDSKSKTVVIGNIIASVIGVLIWGIYPPHPLFIYVGNVDHIKDIMLY